MKLNYNGVTHPKSAPRFKTFKVVNAHTGHVARRRLSLGEACAFVAAAAKPKGWALRIRGDEPLSKTGRLAGRRETRR